MNISVLSGSLRRHSDDSFCINSRNRPDNLTGAFNFIIKVEWNCSCTLTHSWFVCLFDLYFLICTRLMYLLFTLGEKNRNFIKNFLYSLLLIIIENFKTSAQMKVDKVLQQVFTHITHTMNSQTHQDSLLLCLLSWCANKLLA